MLSRPVVIEQEAKSRRARHRWVFLIEGSRIVLERYSFEKRPKQTAPYKVAKFYERHADEPYGDWVWLKAEDVPWGNTLEGEVLDELVKRFEVVRSV